MLSGGTKDQVSVTLEEQSKKVVTSIERSTSNVSETKDRFQMTGHHYTIGIAVSDLDHHQAMLSALLRVSMILQTDLRFVLKSALRCQTQIM